MVDAERSPIKLNLDVVDLSEWSNLGTFLYLRLFNENYDPTFKSMGFTMSDMPEFEESDTAGIVATSPDFPAKGLVEQFAINNGLNKQFMQDLLGPVSFHVADICERVAMDRHRAYHSELGLRDIVAKLQKVKIASQQVRISGLDAKILDHRIVAQYANAIDIGYESRFILANIKS